jgi:tRNA uridine 5-carbamoylmethylation protein Kti12
VTTDIEGKWHKVRSIAFEEASNALKSNNTTVVIDDTNEYRSMRKPYFRLAQFKQFGYLEIHFTSCTYQESILRDSKRPNPVGPDSITKIA